MSEHPFDRYAKACDVLALAETNARKETEKLWNAAMKLKRWKEITIEDRLGSLGGGQKVSLSPSPDNFDVSDYPKIEDIFRLVSDWINARQEAQGAWQAMSQDQQRSVARRH